MIAYNSFLRPTLGGALFGRVANLFLPRANPEQLEILCTNPAALGGGSGGLLLELPAESSWNRYPALYRARCAKANGASWLQIADIAGPADPRPRLTESLGPVWGLHFHDVNLALGNLVDVVERQARVYLNNRR